MNGNGLKVHLVIYETEYVLALHFLWKCLVPVLHLGNRAGEHLTEEQLLFVTSSEGACIIWPRRNTAVRAAVFCASFEKKLYCIYFSFFLVQRFPKICPPALPGASAAGERGSAEDGVRRGEGRSHRLPRARSDAVLEGAAHVLRGVPSTDHHGDRQAEVLQLGPRSDHLDGIHHLSDRDRRKA